MFLKSNTVLLRNFQALQTAAIQIQKVDPEKWRIWVTDEEMAYLRRRKNANPNLFTRLLSRITVLNSRASLFAAS